MQVFNREKAIQSLVSNDMDYVNTTSGGLEWLESMLRQGFTGYDTYTDHDLVEECLNRDLPDSHYFDETDEVN